MKRNKHLGETMKLNDELQFPVLVQGILPVRALVAVLARALVAVLARVLIAALKLIQVQAPAQTQSQASGLS